MLYFDWIFLSFLCFSYFWIKTKHQIRLLVLGFEPRHTSRCFHMITRGRSANWTIPTCQKSELLKKSLQHLKWDTACIFLPSQWVNLPTHFHPQHISLVFYNVPSPRGIIPPFLFNTAGSSNVPMFHPSLLVLFLLFCLRPFIDMHFDRVCWCLYM